MHEIPKDYQAADVDAIRQHYCCAKKFADVCLQEVGLKEVGGLRCPIFSRRRHDLKYRNQVRWIAYNAIGMADMYLSDIQAAGVDRIVLLKSSLRALQEAEAVSPGRWENRCDLGSVKMRISLAANDTSAFHEAEEDLRLVIDALRPGYAFAYYELGRLYRTQNRFSDSEELFNHALKVPSDDRDVSDATIQHQLDLVKKRDASFP